MWRTNALPGSEPRSRRERFVAWLLDDSRRVLPGASLVLVGLIALIDHFVDDVSVAILYLIPIVLASIHLPRAPILALSTTCALLRHALGPYEYGPLSLPVVSLGFISYASAGLFTHELVMNQRRTLRHFLELQRETGLRREAEEQLRMLVQSSPAAILTLDEEGRIELTNDAAERIFGCHPGELRGRSAAGLLPVVFDLLCSHPGGRPYRNVMNCRGLRQDGSYFMASVWYAAYPTAKGRKAAIILSDSSEELRDIQEASVESLMRNTRVLVGSVAHEIRNFCAAIQVLLNNLSRVPGVSATEDYRALSSLADGLARLTTLELAASSEGEIGTAGLADILDEFRIILSASCREADVRLEWNVPDILPVVVGDHYNLLHVFLNLARNGQRAMADTPAPVLEIKVDVRDDYVTVRFHDTGAGVADPERLFRAFQVGADGSGLGLFVSRALVRACEGELFYVPGTPGCTMAVRLRPAGTGASVHDEMRTEVDA